VAKIVGKGTALNLTRKCYQQYSREICEPIDFEGESAARSWIPDNRQDPAGVRLNDPRPAARFTASFPFGEKLLFWGQHALQLR
jgi:hypothetical protein